MEPDPNPRHREPPGTDHDAVVAPFVGAVMQQLIASGDVAHTSSRAVEAARARILALIHGAEKTLAHSHATVPADDPASILAADAHLAAAFFQNIDVLYATDAPQADAVAALIMHALTLMRGAEGPLGNPSAMPPPVAR